MHLHWLLVRHEGLRCVLSWKRHASHGSLLLLLRGLLLLVLSLVGHGHTTHVLHWNSRCWHHGGSATSATGHLVELLLWLLLGFGLRPLNLVDLAGSS